MFIFKYLAILKQHSSFSLLRLIMFGLIAGVSGTVLLIIINNVIGLDPQNKNFYPKLFIGFVAVMGVHHLMQKWYQTSLIRLSQKLVWSIRMKVLDNIRHADLLKYLAFGNSRVFNVLTTDAGNISSIGSMIASVSVSAVTILTCMIYLLYLTVPGFFVTLALMAIIGTIYKVTENRITRQIIQARKEEDSFFEYLNNITFGIKELKLNHKKSEKIYEEARLKAQRAQEMITRCSVSGMNNTLLGGFFFFTVICTLLFILPYFRISLLGNTPQYILITLYILRPAQEIAHMLPFFTQAKVSIDRFNELSALQTISSGEARSKEIFDAPKKLKLSDVSFRFNGENSDHFSIGPLNLDISAGQIIFITGGNGSGKSTLINLLCGLYVPVSGSMTLDGVEITNQNVVAYRSLYAAVFTDSYLFRKHFGIEPKDDAAMTDLLEELGLKSKVRFENSTFSTVFLSYGQQKRMSLACSLIENKSIYIFDELCANQDSGFKVYFYNTLLPALKQKGKMVIVITHDERFVHVADKRYHMESGLVKETN